jgi:acyl transferase domain-containing protein
MGSMMKDGVIGGQTIYPVTDENWVIQQDKLDLVLNAIKEANLDPDCQAHVSIFFGGYVVIGSNEKGQRWLLKNLPAIEDKYPLKLPNHAAFHTPLLKDTSEEAFSVVSQRLFSSPRIPMIDGRGKIWQPFSTDTKELRDYTLGEQVYDTYHFTKAVQVGLKEFAPDRVCVLGPGSSLGGAVGQIMIDAGWHGLKSKEDFMARQESDPLVLAAGREDQRKILQGK